jgi:uncharacterized membrane protein YfcA
LSVEQVPTIEQAGSTDIDFREARIRPSRSVVRFNLAIGLTVIALWALIGRERAFEAVHHHWSISLTMVFGSLVGGGTSEGGGAVSFPVFTKILHIPSNEARIFTYAIQSFGMGCASLSILYLRLPIEKRILYYAAPAGVAGVLLSSNEFAPSLALPEIRIYFTVLLTSLALALIILRARRITDRNLRIPRFGAGEAVILVLTGFAGGVVSGLVGVGENIVAFIVLVMLFRVSEKIVTPTTVILMAIVSMAGFFSHGVIMHDFKAPVTQYWLAAVPIVALGAPLGALICTRLNRDTIRAILIVLITADLVSTLVMIHIPTSTRVIGALVLVGVTTLCLLLTKVSRYDPPAELLRQ